MVPPKKIWINTGEASGDMHGAELLRALRECGPPLRFMGMGGPLMRAEAGFTPLFRTEDLSVMGITEVVAHLPRIVSLLRGIKAALRRERPDAVIVIDAPSFHFRVIKAARALGIPVYYYISPKIWAWKEYRGWFIKENVRKLYCILPFEVDFYKRFGMDVEYVGNPLVDIIAGQMPDGIQTCPGLIGLLPGSRKREISALLPQFAQSAGILAQHMPSLRFACGRAPGVSEEYLRNYWKSDVPVVFAPPEERYVLMRQSEMLIAASGTVTLEAALIGTPALVTYKVSRLSYAVGRALVHVPYVSLPNLILGKELYPELLQGKCDAAPLAAAALNWLRPPEGANPLHTIRRELAAFRGTMGEPGAAGRAVLSILSDLHTQQCQVVQEGQPGMCCERF